MFALVIVALSGCGGSARPKGESPPNGDALTRTAMVTPPPARLALRLSAGDHSVTSATTTIGGTATRGATITVNERRAFMHGSRWSRAVHLHLGRNRIVVKATLSGHPPVRKTITITRKKSAAEIEAQRDREAQKAREARAEQARERATSQPTEGASTPAECTNGTYVNSAGNTVCRPEESPSAPAGATAECNDGTYSFSESRSGTCSHHGGVARWL